MNYTVKTRPRRAFGKRPPAPRKPKGKPGRLFVGAHGGGSEPSRGCLPLAHPRALPAVVVSDRRSPSAMFELPFECWGVQIRLPLTKCHPHHSRITSAPPPHWLPLALLPRYLRATPAKHGGSAARPLLIFRSTTLLRSSLRSLAKAKKNVEVRTLSPSPRIRAAWTRSPAPENAATCASPLPSLSPSPWLRAAPSRPPAPARAAVCARRAKTPSAARQRTNDRVRALVTSRRAWVARECVGERGSNGASVNLFPHRSRSPNGKGKHATHRRQQTTELAQ